jgi:hypothetical protein
MLSSGLGLFDTNLRGRRCALLQEIRDGILRHYRETYGSESHNYRLAVDNQTFEPRVAESVLSAMVSGESGIRVIMNHRISSVVRCGGILRAVKIRSQDGPDDSEVRGETEIEGGMFVDASYEGDLAAFAGAPFRVGRESRAEHGEPHAGRLFTRKEDRGDEGQKFPYESSHGLLNLRPFDSCSGRIFPGSTGEGDKAVMAYNYRIMLSRDPGNQVPIPKPDRYDRSKYEGLLQDERESWRVAHPVRSRWLLRDIRAFEFRNHREIPNRKISWNHGDFPGANHDYPEADWPRRREILRAHLDHDLGLLWFLQNDDDVPEEVRAQARTLGLAQDEFVDNCNLPWEIYVREARRIIGRHVFTEFDASVAPSSGRTPTHPDAIAIAEWMMDSHDCTARRQPGSASDGSFMLSEATRPSQVPYRCLVPLGLENLLVTVCVSATHVGWGTLRVEPVWIQIGEAAGFALAHASAAGVAPANVDVDAVQRRLAEHRAMLGFFNDVDLDDRSPWVPAIQYFSTKGFFATYDARPAMPLDRRTAVIWVEAVCDQLEDSLDSAARVRQVALADRCAGAEAAAITAGEFRAILRSRAEFRLGERCSGWLDVMDSQELPNGPELIARGAACFMLFSLVGAAYPGMPRHYPRPRS